MDVADEFRAARVVVVFAPELELEPPDELPRVVVDVRATVVAGRARLGVASGCPLGPSWAVAPGCCSSVRGPTPGSET